MDYDNLCKHILNFRPILELIIRSQPHISLEGAKLTSPARRYVRVKDKDHITKEDLDFSTNEESEEG
jgi:hypothetical protein